MVLMKNKVSEAKGVAPAKIQRWEVKGFCWLGLRVGTPVSCVRDFWKASSDPDPLAGMQGYRGWVPLMCRGAS